MAVFRRWWRLRLSLRPVSTYRGFVSARACALAALVDGGPDSRALGLGGSMAGTASSARRTLATIAVYASAVGGTVFMADVNRARYLVGVAGLGGA